MYNDDMKRNSFEQLNAWKESPNRKPLVIFGARQIGKTFSVLEFGKKEYENTVYCNFEGDASLAGLFTKDLTSERIIKSLGALKNIRISKGTTLIFFDEIQACEAALTSLKYFNEQANEYHIIAAGSLLGLAVNRSQFSFPVGKVDLLNMFPMTFTEFLESTGNDQLCSMIKENYASFEPLPKPLHEKALDLYRTFLVVGGYPEAVKTYIETSDFNLVRSVQNNISNAYISDMSKYAFPVDTIKSMAIFNSIHSQLAKENTKFQYSVVKAGARSKDYEISLIWLEYANVVLKCTMVTEGKYPVKIYEEANTFKLYYSDVGLLSMRMSLNPDAVIHNIGLSDKASGMLAENYVAQELTAMGKSLYYWSSGNSAEVDFIVQDDSVTSVIPLETKSADNVKAKSLKVYTGLYNPAYAVRVSARNFGFENNIKSIPLYALFVLSK